MQTKSIRFRQISQMYYLNTYSSLYFQIMVLYVVEHLEEGENLSDWCRLEYMHMLETITLPDKVVFTNVTSPRSRDLLARENSLVFANPLKNYLSADSLSFPGCPEIKFSKTCLLDMKADGILTPGDAVEFDAVVFGGILGNVHVMPDGTYSSDDKTSIVRSLGFKDNRRHLGELQMTTDTALIVTAEILRNQTQFNALDFTDHPEIPAGDDCTIMEGFRYLQRNGKIVLPPGMAQLLADSMDFDLTDEL